MNKVSTMQTDRQMVKEGDFQTALSYLNNLAYQCGEKPGCPRVSVVRLQSLSSRLHSSRGYSAVFISVSLGQTIVLGCRLAPCLLIDNLTMLMNAQTCSVQMGFARPADGSTALLCTGSELGRCLHFCDCLSLVDSSYFSEIVLLCQHYLNYQQLIFSLKLFNCCVTWWDPLILLIHFTDY